MFQPKKDLSVTIIKASLMLWKVENSCHNSTKMLRQEPPQKWKKAASNRRRTAFVSGVREMGVKGEKGKWAVYIFPKTSLLKNRCYMESYVRDRQALLFLCRVDLGVYAVGGEGVLQKGNGRSALPRHSWVGVVRVLGVSSRYALKEYRGCVSIQKNGM